MIAEVPPELAEDRSAPRTTGRCLPRMLGSEAVDPRLGPARGWRPGPGRRRTAVRPLVAGAGQRAVPVGRYCLASSARASPGLRSSAYRLNRSSSRRLSVCMSPFGCRLSMEDDDPDSARGVGAIGPEGGSALGPRRYGERAPCLVQGYSSPPARMPCFRVDARVEARHDPTDESRITVGRDGPTPRCPPGEARGEIETEIAVVGGGIVGITAALLLAEAGRTSC